MTKISTAAELLHGEPWQQRISTDLAQRGWSVCDNHFSPLLLARLAEESERLWRRGAFRRAGVGRGGELRLRPEIRTDQVLWLDPADCTVVQKRYLHALEQLRLAINRDLLLGLFEFEGHLAVYPPGSYYRRHLDQFKGVGSRTVSCILYLNREWQAEDGGQLRIYTHPDDPAYCEEILPVGGRLVTFLSARFLHEVLPARRERWSITGWFKRRDDYL